MTDKNESLDGTVHTGSVQTVETEMPKQESTPAPTQRKVRVGFTAAVLEDGEFAFNIHGSNPGLVELHGLVEFAHKVIDAQMKDQLNIGDAVVLTRLEELNKQVADLNERMKSLSAT